MSNVLKMAKKDFSDLLGNRMILAVVIAYIIFSLFEVYQFKVISMGSKAGVTVMYQSNPGVAGANYVFYMLTWLGTLIGIVIGCSTISSERFNNALNTLIVKPLYRDTIINGKLLGSIIFLSSIMILIMTIFTSGFMVLCGSYFSSYLGDYFSRLPFVFIFALVYIMIFLSVSMLISILIRDQTFAMILSILTVYFSLITSFESISGYLNNIFPSYGFGTLLGNFSPLNILHHAQPLIMNIGVSPDVAFFSVLPDFINMLIYVSICLVLSYIVFIKRDIS